MELISGDVFYEICQHLTPIEIVTFACCNKTLYSFFCQERLTELVQQKIDCRDSDGGGDRDIHWTKGFGQSLIKSVEITVGPDIVYQASCCEECSESTENIFDEKCWSCRFPIMKEDKVKTISLPTFLPPQISLFRKNNCCICCAECENIFSQNIFCEKCFKNLIMKIF